MAKPKSSEAFKPIFQNTIRKTRNGSTATPKRKRSEEKEVVIIDVSDDEEDLPSNDAPPTKRGRHNTPETNMSASVSTSQTPSDSTQSSQNSTLAGLIDLLKPAPATQTGTMEPQRADTTTPQTVQQAQVVERSNTQPEAVEQGSFRANTITPLKHSKSTSAGPSHSQGLEAQQLPTPNLTPMKTGPYAYPELAERYIPQIDSANGIEYRNPQKFCLKPGFWQKWKPGTYSLLAEHLRLQFNPIPFAQQTGIPVEEIKHVFSAIVANPLYDAREASRRGEEGMAEILESHNKFGTPVRKWGRHDPGRGGVLGELSGVSKGSVQLTLENGTKGYFPVGALSEVDVKYLKDELTEEDASIFWGRDGV